MVSRNTETAVLDKGISAVCSMLQMWSSCCSIVRCPKKAHPMRCHRFRFHWMSNRTYLGLCLAGMGLHIDDNDSSDSQHTMTPAHVKCLASSSHCPRMCAVDDLGMMFPAHTLSQANDAVFSSCWVAIWRSVMASSAVYVSADMEASAFAISNSTAAHKRTRTCLPE